MFCSYSGNLLIIMLCVLCRWNMYFKNCESITYTYTVRVTGGGKETTTFIKFLNVSISTSSVGICMCPTAPAAENGIAGCFALLFCSQKWQNPHDQTFLTISFFAFYANPKPCNCCFRTRKRITVLHLNLAKTYQDLFF